MSLDSPDVGNQLATVFLPVFPRLRYFQLIQYQQTVYNGHNILGEGLFYSLPSITHTGL